MGKIDSVKEKINLLRDEYRNMFVFFMAVLTGSFTVFYQVVTAKLVTPYAIIGAVGLAIALIVLFKIKKIKNDIDHLIEKLEELE